MAMARHFKSDRGDVGSSNAGGRRSAAPEDDGAPRGSRVTSTRNPRGTSKDAPALGERSYLGDFTPDEKIQPMIPLVGEGDGLVRVRHKRKDGRRRLAVGLGIFVLALALICGGIAYFVHSLNSTMRPSADEYRALVESLAAPGVEGPAGHPNAFYALIVGSDARDGTSGARGDVIMLARIDPDAGCVHLVSIPRDTMIEIEGHGVQKINAAYAYGGAAGMVDAVSAFAGVPISHYVEIGFDGLVRVVDRVGGIWVDVPEAFTVGDERFMAGTQRLTGERALIYARERHSFSGGDFTRAQSQRQVVQGVVRAIMDAPPTQIPGIITDLAQMVSTDYGVTDLVRLALGFRSSGVTTYSCVCPSYAYDADGVSYVATMYDEWQDLMRRVDAGLDTNDTDAPIPEPQASDTMLGAAPNGASPHDYHELAESSMSTDDVDAAG